MKNTSTAFLLFLIAAPAVGHDFWVQPAKFQAEPNAPISIDFQIGHGSARDRWNNNQRIVSLQHFDRGMTRDLRPQLRRGPGPDLVTSFATPGIHVVAMQSNYATSNLPASRFNDYAREEGLTPILAARHRTGRMNSPGRERYSRRAKTLFQIGPVTPAGLSVATRPIGLKLEIVPERNPYALGSSRRLPVHILYNGRRLSGATVKLTNLANDERPLAVAVTDRAGRARFTVPATGAWLINVVWTEPVVNDRRVDFDTTFSSLTFGYPG